MIANAIEVLDLTTHVRACYPRMLWQILFNHYKAQNGPLEHLDNLLCDYENCKRLYEKFTGKPVSFLWSMYPGAFPTFWMSSEHIYLENIELTKALASGSYHLLVTVHDKQIISETI